MVTNTLVMYNTACCLLVHSHSTHPNAQASNTQSARNCQNQALLQGQGVPLCDSLTPVSQPQPTYLAAVMRFLARRRCLRRSSGSSMARQSTTGARRLAAASWALVSRGCSSSSSWESSGRSELCVAAEGSCVWDLCRLRVVTAPAAAAAVAVLEGPVGAGAPLLVAGLLTMGDSGQLVASALAAEEQGEPRREACFCS